jgi:hypothetical protein
MNIIKLVILSVASAFMPTLRTRFSTANTAAEDVADLQKQFTALQETNSTQADQIAALTKQVAASKTVAANPLPPISSEIALLAKGAGVEVSDVRWRVAQGLSPAQAVQAASLQVARDKARESANKTAKAAKAGK